MMQMMMSTRGLWTRAGRDGMLTSATNSPRPSETLSLIVAKNTILLRFTTFINSTHINWIARNYQADKYV